MSHEILVFGQIQGQGASSVATETESPGVVDTTKTIQAPLPTGTLALAAFPFAPTSLTILAPATPALAAADAEDHDSFRARPCGHPAIPIVADGGRRARAASVPPPHGRPPAPAGALRACGLRVPGIGI